MLQADNEGVSDKRFAPLIIISYSDLYNSCFDAKTDLCEYNRAHFGRAAMDTKYVLVCCSLIIYKSNTA